MAKFQVLMSELIYPGRAFTLRRDTLKTPDGRETRLDIIEHIGSVVILPVDGDGNLLFVRQYRHPTGTDLLELPAGTLNQGEEPEACARRELREETGMAAATMKHLGSFYLAPGYSTEYMHAYLASDLSAAPLAPDEDEYIALERVPIAMALAMAQHGDLPDAKSLAVLCLATRFLQEK